MSHATSHVLGQDGNRFDPDEVNSVDGRDAISIVSSRTITPQLGRAVVVISVF